jgi:exopolyphosphatase/pppGpp-phosphohydrolase
MSLLAVVDLGSNSLKVSVVDAATRREVARASEPVRIFPATLGEFTLSRETQVEAAEAVRRLAEFARAQDVAVLGGVAAALFGGGKGLFAGGFFSHFSCRSAARLA